MLRVLRALPALLLLAATSARADERIHRFLSDVQIEKDSTLEVTETIDVEVDNVAINHGIYRDFPTRYRRPDGSAMRVGFALEGATLDGLPVPASVSSMDNGVRVKLGDPDKIIAQGEHSFVLRYRTTRQVGRFNDYDELYWNATGNGWQFPIDLAEARIRLPQAVSFGKRTLYTGAYGSTAANAEIVDEQPGDILVRTTQPLAAFEGLTVAVAFPKGVVGEPAPGSQLGWWLADNGPPILGFLVLLGVCTFYYVAWARAGRDPPAGTVVPLFSPPDDLSPPGMRYVTKMSADNRAFAAALVDMGVHGHIRMSEEDEGWFSNKKTRIDRLEDATSPLPDEETAALEELCEPGGMLLMEQRNHEKFAAAKTVLNASLKRQYEGKLFKRNYGWAAAGLMLFLAGLWLTAASVVIATGAENLVMVGTILGCLLVVALLWLAFHDTPVGKCLLSLISTIGVMVAFSFGFPLIAEALNTGWWLPLLLPALAAPLVLSAFWWISAPTAEGRPVLDHIAGFKQYLSITEAERLDRMTPPKDTPELFEKYLPYAIALGVENRWAERFASVLAAAAAQGHQGFAWYSGSSNPWDNPRGFTDAVGSSLASSISSASTAPGSASGSGGGGFSGGGGGGGGGGGW